MEEFLVITIVIAAAAYLIKKYYIGFQRIKRAESDRNRCNGCSCESCSSCYQQIDVSVGEPRK